MADSWQSFEQAALYQAKNSFVIHLQYFRDFFRSVYFHDVPLFFSRQAGANRAQVRSAAVVMRDVR